MMYTPPGPRGACAGTAAGPAPAPAGAPGGGAPPRGDPHRRSCAERRA